MGICSLALGWLLWKFSREEAWRDLQVEEQDRDCVRPGALLQKVSESKRRRICLGGNTLAH